MYTVWVSDDTFLLHLKNQVNWSDHHSQQTHETLHESICCRGILHSCQATGALTYQDFNLLLDITVLWNNHAGLLHSKCLKDSVFYLLIPACKVKWVFSFPNMTSACRTIGLGTIYLLIIIAPHHTLYRKLHVKIGSLLILEGSACNHYCKKNSKKKQH